MKRMADSGLCIPGMLLVLFLSGCTGLSGGQRPPVVDRGVMAPEQAVPREEESTAVETRPLPGYGTVPEGRPLQADGEPRYGTVPAGRPLQTGGEPPAVVALLDHAEQQANDGDLDGAAVTLERALRIDSRNPVLWHHLATVRLADGEPVQAEQLAAKSNSLAGSNPALQARNWLLIARARQARGDTAGARSAERQAQTLQQR